MDNKSALLKILKRVGPERIRRPVYDSDNQLLALGVADAQDGSLEDFARVDFSGKTVVDLGCNLGQYSFLASRRGAKYILGIDLDDLILQGSKILRDMQNISNVDFACMDFTAPVVRETFDISMLIDFIGKGIITQGLNHFLNAAERITRETMLISARHHYRIDKHLNGDMDTLVKLYTAKYVCKGSLFLADYITDYFDKKWQPTILSKPDHRIDSKITLCFQRK